MALPANPTATVQDVYDALVVLSTQDDVRDTAIADLRVDNTAIANNISDIKTATMGSWLWDKSTGIMTMYDAAGVPKFKFQVSDSAEQASRERRQDLES